MRATVIDGKAIACCMHEDLKQETLRLKNQGLTPGLAVILVGNNPASEVYVRRKERVCKELGFYSHMIRCSAQVTQEEILSLVRQCNHNTKIHGILIQLPLPPHLNEKKVLNTIDVTKDVDGFTAENMGNLMSGQKGILPCTPAGIMELLKRTGEDLAGKHAVVIGRSNIVGKPTALLLLAQNATVTICHSKTQRLEKIARQADILVVAVGVPRFVKSAWIKPGAVVIDVGMNRLANGQLCGDVDYDPVREIAGWLTPVPGGVGPMTITMLMANTLQLAKTQATELA